MDKYTATDLVAKKCRPCEGGVEPCSLEFSKSQLTSLNDWQLNQDGTMICRSWKLRNFVQAMNLLNEAASIAEEDQHHPDLHLTGYKNVKIELTTHAIGGLSENDFILAAKIDAAAERLL